MAGRFSRCFSLYLGCKNDILITNSRESYTIQKAEGYRKNSFWTFLDYCIKKYQGEQWITRSMAVELIRCIYVSEHNKLEIVWNFQDEFARLAAETGGIGT